MYQNPVLFPAISNRESWAQTVQIVDDQTGDLISLVDGSGNPLYGIYLEIRPAHRHGGYSGSLTSSYYDASGCDQIIFASLSDYISIVDMGTIDIQIPYTVMQKLHGNQTFDVFLRIEDAANNDARQLITGSLPIFHGGRGP